MDGDDLMVETADGIERMYKVTRAGVASNSGILFWAATCRSRKLDDSKAFVSGYSGRIRLMTSSRDSAAESKNLIFRLVRAVAKLLHWNALNLYDQCNLMD